MSFGFETTAEEAASYFAQRIAGKNVLITGASPNSLGAECARVLAKNGCGLLVLAGRTMKNLEDTEKAIKAETPNANIRLLEINLQDMDSVRKAAAEVNAYSESLNVLIQNAATMATPYYQTPLGESQWVGNHVGHFLFSNLILGKLVAHGDDLPRVVNVSSMGHHNSGIRFDDLDFGKGKNYDPWQAYGQSKTGNILLSRSLAQRNQGKLLAYSLHPGVISTNLSRDLDPAAAALIEELLKNPAIKFKTIGQGAATHVVAAFSPEIVTDNGAYLDDCKVNEAGCAEHAKGQELAERLWKVSEGLVNETF